MQDFFEASGLSAGLVYRYFRSKEELVALAGGALQVLHASVEEAIAAGGRPGTEEVVARLLRTIDELDARERIARVAVQVWGEALVNPVPRVGLREPRSPVSRRPWSSWSPSPRRPASSTRTWNRPTPPARCTRSCPASSSSGPSTRRSTGPATSRPPGR